MRTLVVTLGLFFAQTVLCQDSIRTIDKIFAVDSSRHAHVIDIRVAEYYDLGYNYYYLLNKKIALGGRIGLWHYKSDPFQYPINKPRIGFSYYFNTSANIQIWKSTSVEFDFGYYNRISWPHKSNTIPEEQGYQVSFDFYTFGVSLKAILFNHLVFKEGIIIRYSSQGDFWIPFPVISLGYKF